jgi:GT2 family glycosyltransferase
MKISVILVNFHSEEMINFLISQLKHSELEFVIVDNSSSFLLDNQMERVKVVNPGENIGFGRAVNSALPFTQGQVIILLNPDVRIDLDSILNLASLLVTKKEIGIVAPLLTEKQHRGPFLNGGFWPTIPRMFMHMSFASRISYANKLLRGIYGHKQSNLSQEIIELDWVSGACCAIRRTDFEEIGGFNERWFMYCEDMELCYHMGMLGKKIGIFPKSTGLHLGGSSDNRLNKASEVNTLWLSNLLQFYKSFYGQNSIWRLFIWIQIASTGFGLRWFHSKILPKFGTSSKEKNSETKKYIAYVFTLQRCLISEMRQMLTKSSFFKILKKCETHP